MKDPKVLSCIYLHAVLPLLEEIVQHDRQAQELVKGWKCSIMFHVSEGPAATLKFRDGTHYAALDGGSITVALATALDHPLPGKTVVAVRTDDVDALARSIEESGGAIVTAPYDDAHERRAVVYDNQGNGLVLYKAR